MVKVHQSEFNINDRPVEWNLMITVCSLTQAESQFLRRKFFVLLFSLPFECDRQDKFYSNRRNSRYSHFTEKVVALDLVAEVEECSR